MQYRINTKLSVLTVDHHYGTEVYMLVYGERKTHIFTIRSEDENRWLPRLNAVLYTLDRYFSDEMDPDVVVRLLRGWACQHVPTSMSQLARQLAAIMKK